MTFSGWKDRHFLSPYDEVSRRKERIKWCRRIILWIALIVIIVLVILSYVEKHPVKVDTKHFDEVPFDLPRTTFCFYGIYEFEELYVDLFDSAGDSVNMFHYSRSGSICTHGLDEVPCTTPWFDLEPFSGFNTSRCLAIVVSKEWSLSNYEGSAVVYAHALPAKQPYGLEFLSDVVDIVFDIDVFDNELCPKKECESLLTSSVIPSRGFSQITLTKDTLVDEDNLHIISYPFKVGSVALSEKYSKQALEYIGMAPAVNDTVFIAVISTNAKIVLETFLERRRSLTLRIIESVLGIFGGIVIIGELLMTFFNHCFFTGTDTIDHELRDPSLYMIREQIQQQHLKPPGTEINMMPAGTLGGPPVAFRN